MTPERDVPIGTLRDFARTHGVRRLAVFGSAARGELTPESDLDVLVEWQTNARIGVFEHVRIAEELERTVGRRVHLLTWDSLPPRMRARVEQDALTVYDEAG